jgi:hypothetical protein
MSVGLLIPKYHQLGQGFSRREQAAALVHPGRRTDGSQSAASWVADLADTRKVVLFCTYCRGKFNPRRNGYRVFFNPDARGMTSGFTANGVCDGCKQPTALLPGGGTAFIAEETYAQVCLDPSVARRRARAAAGATSAWDRVRTFFGGTGSRAPVEGSTQQETIHG